MRDIKGFQKTIEKRDRCYLQQYISYVSMLDGSCVSNRIHSAKISADLSIRKDPPVKGTVTEQQIVL